MNDGVEVPGLPQPPPVGVPLRRLVGGKKGAALRAARKMARGARSKAVAAKKGLAAAKRGVAALRARSKQQLKQKRAQVRALKAQVRALKAANPGSLLNRARGGRGSRRSSGGRWGGGFVLWAVRKALRLGKRGRVSDFRNHGARGVNSGAWVTGRRGIKSKWT